jgi:NAD(P)-dependent dehydrogenase (short-subunit alcohol dehydrogenase family)
VSERAAIIIGAKGGIGAALADAMEQRNDGTRVIRLHRASTPPVDLADEDSIAAAAAEIEAMAYDISLVVVATGLLHADGRGPEKSLRELDAAWMARNFQINAIGPALVAKHFLPIMVRQNPIYFAALSARVGSISDNRLGGWHSYRASKAALNMLIRNIAIEWQRKNPQSVVVGLHPGTVETSLSAPFRGNPAHERFTPERSAQDMLSVLHGLSPEESGQIFAYDGSIITP